MSALRPMFQRSFFFVLICSLWGQLTYGDSYIGACGEGLAVLGREAATSVRTLATRRLHETRLKTKARKAAAENRDLTLWYWDYAHRRWRPYTQSAQKLRENLHRVRQGGSRKLLQSYGVVYEWADFYTQEQLVQKIGQEDFDEYRVWNKKIEEIQEKVKFPKNEDKEFWLNRFLSLTPQELTELQVDPVAYKETTFKIAKILSQRFGAGRRLDPESAWGRKIKDQLEKLYNHSPEASNYLDPERVFDPRFDLPPQVPLEYRRGAPPTLRDRFIRAPLVPYYRLRYAKAKEEVLQQNLGLRRNQSGVQKSEREQKMRKLFRLAGQAEQEIKIAFINKENGKLEEISLTPQYLREFYHQNSLQLGQQSHLVSYHWENIYLAEELTEAERSRLEKWFELESMVALAYWRLGVQENQVVMGGEATRELNEVQDAHYRLADLFSETTVLGYVYLNDFSRMKKLSQELDNGESWDRFVNDLVQFAREKFASDNTWGGQSVWRLFERLAEYDDRFLPNNVFFEATDPNEDSGEWFTPRHEDVLLTDLRRRAEANPEGVSLSDWGQVYEVSQDDMKAAIQLIEQEFLDVLKSRDVGSKFEEMDPEAFVRLHQLDPYASYQLADRLTGKLLDTEMTDFTMSKLTAVFETLKAHFKPEAREMASLLIDSSRRELKIWEYYSPALYVRNGREDSPGRIRSIPSWLQAGSADPADETSDFPTINENDWGALKEKFEAAYDQSLDQFLDTLHEQDSFLRLRHLRFDPEGEDWEAFLSWLEEKLAQHSFRGMRKRLEVAEVLSDLSKGLGAERLDPNRAVWVWRAMGARP